MSESVPLKLDYRIEETGPSSRLLHIKLESVTMQQLYQEANRLVQQDPNQSVDQLIEQQVEHLLALCYHQVLEETRLQALGPPEVNVLQLGMSTPLEFTAEIQLMPTVTLKSLNEIVIQSPTDPDTLQQAILDAVVDGAEVTPPDQLIDQELESMWMEEQGQKMQQMPEAVRKLSLRNWSQDEEMRTTASRRVKTLLVLMQLAHQEGLQVSEEELSQYLHTLAEEQGPEAIEQILAEPLLQQHLADQILLARLMEFLEERITIQTCN